MNLKYIDVAFGARAVTEVKPRYKYDYGQVLRFVDLDLPEAYEVHLSNTNDVGTAKRAIGDADGCEIYDEYFENGDAIYAWLFLSDDESGRTVKKVIIPLREKPRPENSEPTPVQIDIVDIAIGKLNQAVSETEENVRITSEYAEDAETARDAAEAARDAANTSADNSAESARQAAQSASNASQSASTALEAKDDAVEAKEDAETAAERAEQAAATSGYLWFYIENGKLYMDRTPNTQVDFYMQDGKLYVRETA